jgi:hypothetical protein
MYNFRLGVSPFGSTLFQYPSDPTQELAIRAQTCSGIYSGQSSSIIVLLKPSEFKTYASGRTANQG